MGKLTLFCSVTVDGVIDSTAEWVDLSPEHQAYSTGPLEWNGRLLDADDAMGHLARVKAETDGTLVSTGGGELAAGLVEAGLVDELRLFVNPVVWGPGQRLFHEQLADTRFELVRADQVPGRVFELVYRPQLR